MRVIPVIDLKGGNVVRAVAGQRAAYAPVQSCLVASSEPALVAQALIKTFAASEIYVADIDALQGGAANDHALRDIAESGAPIWLDRGLRTIHDLSPALASQQAADQRLSFILASESVAGPTALAALASALDIDRTIFSLDLKSQATLASSVWNNASPEEIVDIAVQLGVRRFIVLDLARVGISTGTGTITLCTRLRRLHPHIELYAGGGVRNLDDLLDLHHAGCTGALVASALHDGRLTAADLQQIASL